MSFVEIHRLELHYRAPAAMRAQLDELAVRYLPAALEQALGGLDDGRIIVLRRVKARAQLGRLGDPEFVASWAAQLAHCVEQCIRQVRPDPSAEVAVFADAIAALASYIADVLSHRQDAWWWQEPGALSLIRNTLAAVPGSAPALGPSPRPQTPIDLAIAWALRVAGAALPRLLLLLHHRQQASAALAALSAVQAQTLLTQLDLAPAPPDFRPEAQFIGALMNLVAVVRTPAPRDPRNVLLLASLVLARQPELGRAPGLREAIELALEQREQALRLEPPGSPWRPVAAADQRPAEQAAATESLLLPLDLFSPGAPTAFGGLLFLIAPLCRLRIAEAILQEPMLGEGFGFAPLLYLLLCFLWPEAFTDPATLWSAGLTEPTVPALASDAAHALAIRRVDARIQAAADALPARLLPTDEAALREHVARLPLAVPAGLAELCSRTVLRIVGYLRACLEQDEDPALAALLKRVCEKPGRLVRTHTHLDLYLPLECADIAIRKAGLDLNPGWMPVLGCVVNFHYD